MNILDFRKMKSEKRKISMVTCYDHWSARIIAQTDIDCILVGDSVAMVVHGYPSTLHADVDMMKLHTQAVARGAPGKFLVADMPFPTFRRGIPAALDCVDHLMKAGAQAVKLEGVEGHEDVVRALVGSGVPVMGHLGLTPQSIHQLGGFRVQGREERAVAQLRRDARTLQELGAFSLVLECVPSQVAAEISEELSIPVIGIGAGSQTDGQVLVLQDLLGMNPSFKPKFVRHFLNGEESLRGALQQYHQDVTHGTYPNAQESYT
jgi:3-methyl-2-oxobutanoate hydroxymethyltransferase